MILLFLPAMTLHASVLIGATIFIVVDEISRSPIITLLLRVYIEMRLSSEILPIVGENALVPLVIVFIVGAPHSLEMKHIEV